MRDLDTREDVQGHSIKLTIDGRAAGLSPRGGIGLQSAACVVIDCHDGGILAMVSMPCFDPNTFANGIGRIEWKMLNEDDHIPLLNKAVRGLYPPGSTVKPMASLALQMPRRLARREGQLPGRVPARQPLLPLRRAARRRSTCAGAIEHSCNIYFWTWSTASATRTSRRWRRQLGLGQEFDLPGSTSATARCPIPPGRCAATSRNGPPRTALNAAIGQGYVLVSPLQLAVMASRIASGRNLVPSLLFGQTGRWAGASARLRSSSR